MSLREVAIIVEGQTEEGFVKRLLQEHLLAFDVLATPILVSTKPRVQSRLHKGGVTSFSNLQGTLGPVLGGSHFRLVTTMLDYYALPDDFPGMSTRPLGPASQKVDHVEAAVGKTLDTPRFRPFVMLHEFEALLFSDTTALAKVMDAPEKAEEIRFITEAAGGPEQINDGPDTHPSKRIAALFPRYRKTTHGLIIAAQTGLQTMRERCPRFNGWVTVLEQLV